MGGSPESEHERLAAGGAPQGQRGPSLARMFPNQPTCAPPRANRIASPKVLHAALAPVAAGASFLDDPRRLSQDELFTRQFRNGGSIENHEKITPRPGPATHIRGQ